MAPGHRRRRPVPERWPAPARPAGSTAQSTLPYGVDAGGTLLMPWVAPAAIAEVARAGSSLAAARPGGYRDGAEDATTVPSAAIATTAVTAWPLWIGPVIAGTASVPSWAGWPGSPSTVPAGTPPG